MTEQVTEHTCTQANIHRHIDTHTYRHTHTYTYIYIYIFFFFFPGKNTEVGWHFLLQGIFPTQGLNLSPALEDGFFITAPPGKAHIYVYTHTHIYLFLSFSRNWLFFFFNSPRWWQAPALCSYLSKAFTPEAMSHVPEWLLPSQATISST